MASHNSHEASYFQVTNISARFNTGCPLDMADIALRAYNTDYKTNFGCASVSVNLYSVNMKFDIFPSGKINCKGGLTAEQTKTGARQMARIIQKLGYPVVFRDFRIVQVWAKDSLPYHVDLAKMATELKLFYEPELQHFVQYKIAYPKASVNINFTGKLVIIAPSMANAREAAKTVHKATRRFERKVQLL